MCGSTSSNDTLMAEAIAAANERTGRDLVEDIREQHGQPSNLAVEAYEDLAGALRDGEVIEGQAVAVYGFADHTIEVVDLATGVYAGYRLDPYTGECTGKPYANDVVGLVAAVSMGIADLGSIDPVTA